MHFKVWYQQLKNIYHFFQAHCWRLFYGRPDQGLTIYGVTGTNGKTTTCYVLTSILSSAFGEDKVGMLTTVAFRVGEKQEFNKTKMTTLKSRRLYQYLKEMKQAGVTHVVLEITSHALHQHRLAGIRLDGAIILNVAREHLDYHYTMEDYAAAKQKIITYLRPQAPLIGKADDERVNKMLDQARQHGVPTHSFTSQQAQAVTTPLPGEVNKENVLAATLLAQAVGIAPDKITQGIAKATHVPGRMEWIQSTSGIKAVIDYAVTPDALERLYQYVRSVTPGKIYAILGAAGLRDRGKRPDMARAVAQYADHLIITNEDPWTESVEQIFQDLESGLDPAKKLNAASPASSSALVPGWQRIPDRREALRFAVQHAQTGDVIIATGKGAERGMAMGKHIIPWNERAIIEALFKEKETHD